MSVEDNRCNLASALVDIGNTTACHEKVHKIVDTVIPFRGNMKMGGKRKHAA